METMHVGKAELTNLAFLGHFSCVASETTASVFSRSSVKSLLNTFIAAPQLCFLNVETFVWQTNSDMLDSHKRFEWIKKPKHLLETSNGNVNIYMTLKVFI